MWPLFLLTVALFYLIIERTLFFRRLKSGDAKPGDRSINRHISAIIVLTAVAPLLGLLGTVYGMIETFEVISAVGSGDTASLSSGISKALVTTEIGLIVAIPGLFASTKFKTLAAKASIKNG